MAIQLIVAKVRRDELALRGIQSLTAEALEEIAAHIFERISDLELELAARNFNIPTSGGDRPTRAGCMSVCDPLRAKRDNVRGHSPLPRFFIAIVLRGPRGISPR
ncbi:hypothetical protein IVB18_13020 [Bradyrhizobium sp. 186]|uniref:hypothetical protein n=1 Tax=Bradyrhizobium sp. 186 TaxID=2782654 RepID=UPI002000BAE2|nr:hypothetical protein [Bradyrhizobium sp. 186]UPK38106.1 hypothetical protein IVB18_13020 [Bradyrhizobium sp. 186]